jgi:non-specific serine/threonine protein kinase
MVNSSGLDWFQFEPTIQIAGQRLALQELARLMVDNKGYFKTSSGYVKIDESSQAELQALKKMGAFKVGKKFNRAEMMPLLTLANVASKDEKAQAWFTQLKTMHTSGHCEPGPGFQGTLRDYQQNGLNWMNFLYQTGLGGILADDMGLGKTIQSIAFCSQLKTDLPILVVGPTNVIYNWESEIKKFLPQAKVVIYTGSNRAQQEHKLSSATFVITTFGIVKNDSEILSALEFEAIFVDEAQYIKNPQAQISQSMKTLNARFKLAMTGTPVENHLQDLWNLFDFAMPNYLGTKREFDISVKDGQLDVLKAKIKPFVLRREKREVLQSLPEKTEILLKCPMSSAQQQLYETVLSAVKSGIRNSVGKIEKLNILTSLLKLRQVCTHPGLLPELNDPDMESAKFNLATETIAKLVEEGHKVVLFSQFTQMLDILQKWSTSEKIYTERIDGSVTGKNRADAVTRFQTTEKSGLFLISLKAGGVGINLTTADYVIHMDPWWNPAIESQATDRVHRMGQQNKVIVYKLITEGTIEEKIQLLQESKKALLAQIVDIDTMAEKAIDFKEIEALLLS